MLPHSGQTTGFMKRKRPIAAWKLVAVFGAAMAFLCLPATPALGERPRLVIASNGGTSTRREPLERWLLDRVDEALDDLELSEADQRRLDGDEVLQRFVPELVASAETPAAENLARRVKHAKFGVGSVIREVLGGPEPKLEIEFDSGDKRVLLARFVSDVGRAS